MKSRWILRESASFVWGAALLIFLLSGSGCGIKVYAPPDDSSSFSNIAALLALQSVIPASGAFNANTTIQLTGSGFQPGMSVTVQGRPCLNVTVISSTQLTCQTPTGTIGTAQIVVANGPATANLAASYAYVDAVTPTAGFFIVSGGGTLTTSAVRVTTSIGYPVLSSPSITGNVMRQTGFQAILYDPSP